MKEFFKNLSDSLKIGDIGFSARKLSAFWVMVLVTCVHACWFLYQYRKAETPDFSLLMPIIYADFAFILLCLAIVTIDQIIKFKNNSKNDEQKSPPSDNSIPNPGI